jgi:Protein of unknown function (DUF1566)
MKKNFWLFLFLITAIISCTKESDVTALSSSQTSSATQAYSIGEHFGGGIIFYLDKTGRHGIIAASADLEEAQSWSRADTLTGAQSAKVGAGLNNTNKICRVQGVPQSEADNYAALECAEFQANGYNDWYLPSKDELNEMYLHKDIIGGFLPFAYWSSTEANVSQAWFQNFGNGAQVQQEKLAGYSVRPVRYF